MTKKVILFCCPKCNPKGEDEITWDVEIHEATGIRGIYTCGRCGCLCAEEGAPAIFPTFTKIHKIIKIER